MFEDPFLLPDALQHRCVQFWKTQGYVLEQRKAWWHMLIVTGLGRQEQENFGFELHLCYRSKLRPVLVT